MSSAAKPLVALQRVKPQRCAVEVAPGKEFLAQLGVLVLRLALLLPLFLLLLITSCGYHFGPSGALAGYRTITVPYAQNDPDGLLTAELVRELSASSPFFYRQCGGALSLEVRICGVDQVNIGFEYDTDDQGVRTERIVPNEGRLLAVAQVEVVSCADGRVVLGPQCITASVDFDYDPLSTENQLAIFSLGQFTQIDLAEDTAIVPLYRNMARKIVAYVTNGW